MIKWVKFSGMSWKGNGIYYSRYQEPTGSELSQKNQFHKVYYHTLGTEQVKDVLFLRMQSIQTIILELTSQKTKIIFY